MPEEHILLRMVHCCTAVVPKPAVVGVHDGGRLALSSRAGVGCGSELKTPPAVFTVLAPVCDSRGRRELRAPTRAVNLQVVYGKSFRAAKTVAYKIMDGLTSY